MMVASQLTCVLLFIGMSNAQRVLLPRATSAERGVPETGRLYRSNPAN
jgi:hypothetical protein